MQAVCSGSMLVCSMGAGTSPINVISTPGPAANPAMQSAANIMDNKPVVNIRPFGVCRSMSNPQVMAASASARGLVPMPCMPTIPAPWAPGDPMNRVRNAPALSKGSTLMCAWGGVITIASVIPAKF